MKSANGTVLATLVAIFGGVIVTGCSQPKAAPEKTTHGATDAATSGANVPLEGTSWVLAGLPGHGALAGQPATAQFASGRVQGTDGCNRYTAAFTVTGSTLTVDPRGATTRMACPPDVAAQANAFMAALAGATAYRVVDGRLELLSSSGAVLAIMTPQSTSLVGTWNVTGINNGREAVVSILSDGQVDMTFTADGKVAGSAGCNRFTAGFEAEGSSLRFTPAATTRRMCPGEGVMEQEQAFLSALNTVATMRVDGDILELRRTDGALALQLRRVPH